MRNETNSDYINIIISQFIRIITVLVMMLIFEQLNVLYDLSVQLDKEEMSYSCVKAYENAQEKSNWVLNHGCFIADFETDLIEENVNEEETEI